MHVAVAPLCSLEDSNSEFDNDGDVYGGDSNYTLRINAENKMTWKHRINGLQVESIDKYTI